MLKVLEKEVQQEKCFSTLFISFDIVNSTRYKSLDSIYCLNVINGILYKVKELMELNVKRAKFWTTNGDEIIYYLEICNKDEIFDALEKSFSIMEVIRKLIAKGEFPLILNDTIISKELEKEKKEVYRKILSLKVGSWISLVTTNRLNLSIPNKKYENGLIGNLKGVTDFQGPDIDIGFRIIQSAVNRRMVISYELALILSRNLISLNNMHLIAFEKKKGVWDDRKYPVIWYHSQKILPLIGVNGIDKKLAPFKESFFYDEEDYCELTSNYKKHCGSLPVLKDFLHKIKDDLENLGLSSKMENLLERIEESKDGVGLKSKERFNNSIK